MNNLTQHRSWILGIHRRVAGAALAMAIMLVAAVLATGSAQAQIYTESVLYSFKGGTDGWEPEAGLVLDAQGNLYGTTYEGGDLACGPPYGCGTVFKLDTTGKETVLHSFTGPPDGAEPGAGLVLDAQGNLYGTTSRGGTYYGQGTVFMVDTTGTETVLHSFSFGTGDDGAYPQAGLARMSHRGEGSGRKAARSAGGASSTSGNHRTGLPRRACSPSSPRVYRFFVRARHTTPPTRRAAQIRLATASLSAAHSCNLQLPVHLAEQLQVRIARRQRHPDFAYGNANLGPDLEQL